MREVTDDKNKKNAMFLLVFVVAATNKKRHAHTHTQKQGRHHKHTKKTTMGFLFPFKKHEEKNDCENSKNTTQENKVVFFSNEQEIENESKKGLVCAVFSFFVFCFLLSFFRVVGLLFF
jgi:hypothetical protein